MNAVWLSVFTAVSILMCFVTCRYKHILCECCVRTKRVTEIADNSSDSGFGEDQTQRLPQSDIKGPSEATEFKQSSDATDFKAPYIGPTPDLPNILDNIETEYAEKMPQIKGAKAPGWNVDILNTDRSDDEKPKANFD